MAGPLQVLPGAVPARRSRLKPVLLGCAAVLGLGLLVGAGLLAYGLYWFVTPGTQTPTTVVVGPDAVGAIRLNRAASDPGVQALFRKVMLELQRAGRNSRGRKLPPWLETLQSWQASQQSQNLGLWMPSEGTLSFERGPDDERGLPVVALNFRRFIRPMAFVFERLARSDPKSRVERHAGYDVIFMPRGGGLCFASSTLMFAERAEALFPVLDRLTQPASAPPSALIRELEGVSQRWDLAGSLPRRIEAYALMQIVLRAARPNAPEDPDETEGEDETAPDDDPSVALLALESASFGVDVKSADELGAELRARYADVTAAQAAMAALEAPLLSLQRKAIAADLHLNLSRQAIDRELLVEVRLRGLETALTGWMADAAARGEGGGRAR